MQVSKTLTSSSVAQKTNLENARRCVERFQFYTATFQDTIGPSSSGRYMEQCFRNAEYAIVKYAEFVDKVYQGMCCSTSSFFVLGGG